MHLNALYRTAKAGQEELVECVHELSNARKQRGVARNMIGLPIKYWRLHRARQHLAAAKLHLAVVRDNVSIVASLGENTHIDSSGGFAIADLLVGGLLDSLGKLEIGNVEENLADISSLLAQVGELMLRMRKCGAVD